MKTENYVILRGKIVRKSIYKKAAHIMVEPATPMINRPNIVFFGKAIKDIETNYEVGDLVEIHGNLQSSRCGSETAVCDLVSIFGESITKISIERLVTSPDDNNKFYVCGVLQKVIRSCDDSVNFVVLTMKKGRLSYVKLTYRTSEAEKLINVCHIGDAFIGEGSVQTATMLKYGKKRVSEYYVVHDFVTEAEAISEDRKADMAS